MKNINYVDDFDYNDFDLNNPFILYFYKEFNILRKINKVWFEALEEVEWVEKLLDFYNVSTVRELIKLLKDDLAFHLDVINILKNMIINNWNEEFKIQQKEDEDEIKRLENDIHKLETKIKDTRSKWIINWFTKDEVNEAVKHFVEEIEIKKEEINSIKNNSLNSKDLDIFIEAISKIFEHTANMLWEAKTEVKEEHFLQLIKLITFELIFNTKKELKIKLFRGIDKLLFANGIPVIGKCKL